MTDETERGQRRLSEQAAFDRLLTLLHEDREQAGDEYELLRAKLGDYFKVRQCRHPEDLADVALSRLMGKVATHTPIEHVGKYLFGIARLVLLEGLRADEREVLTNEHLSEPALGYQDSLDADLEKRCLSECLAQLSDYERRLFIAYNCVEEHSNKQTRKELAERERLTPMALRLRIHRTREKLLPCLEDCLQRGPKNMKHSAA